MYAVALLLMVSWPAQGPLWEQDNLPVTLVTTKAEFQISGFPNDKGMATCEAYAARVASGDVKLPVATLMTGIAPGSNIAYTTTVVGCRKYKIS